MQLWVQLWKPHTCTRHPETKSATSLTIVVVDIRKLAYAHDKYKGRARWGRGGGLHHKLSSRCANISICVHGS